MNHNLQLRLELLKQKDDKKRTAKHLAFTTAHFDIYKYLRDLEDDLQAGDLLQNDLHANSPVRLLSQHIEAKDLAAIAQILQINPDLIETPDESGQLPVHTAFLESSTEIAGFLLDSGASIHSVGFHAWQPLHIAASIGSLDLTELALERGANVNAKTETGQTPLLKAASASSVQVVRLLLSAGADIRARNDRAMTCLHVAASKDFSECVRELLQPEWGAQDLVHSRDRNRGLPRHWAERSGRLEIATFLRLQERLIENPNRGGGRPGATPTANQSRVSSNASQVCPRNLRPNNIKTTSTLSNEDQDQLHAQLELLDFDSA